jgi:hypothetical protein
VARNSVEFLRFKSSKSATVSVRCDCPPSPGGRGAARIQRIPFQGVQAQVEGSHGLFIAEAELCLGKSNASRRRNGNRTLKSDFHSFIVFFPNALECEVARLSEIHRMARKTEIADSTPRKWVTFVCSAHFRPNSTKISTVEVLATHALSR